MGLDIYHQKATMIPPTVEGVYSYNSQIVLEDEFEGFNVPFNHFEKYIQDVTYKEEVETIFIVKNEDDLNETLDWLRKNNYEDAVFCNSDKQKFEIELREYEKKKGINNLKITIQPENEYRNSQIWEYYYTDKRIGFYIEEEVGYQRKGMNGNFSQRFHHEQIYNFALWEDFEYAYSCVDYYWPSDTKEEVVQRKTDFMENFLRKFELGASYMCVSY